MKLTERQLPTLQFSGLLKEAPPPVPNRFFTPIPDNRDQILAKMKKDLEIQKQQRFNPQNIKRN